MNAFETTLGNVLVNFNEILYSTLNDFYKHLPLIYWT